MSESTEPFRRQSLHGSSLDAVLFRLDGLERSQQRLEKIVAEKHDQVMEGMQQIKLQLASQPDVHELRRDVTAIQEDRWKAKGSWYAVGVICTGLGWLISQAEGWFTRK